MAAQLLIGKCANLLMHRVFVAANALGFAHVFQRAQNVADFALQTLGIVPHACGGQLGFTDIH